LNKNEIGPLWIETLELELKHGDDMRHRRPLDTRSLIEGVSITTSPKFRISSHLKNAEVQIFGYAYEHGDQTDHPLSAWFVTILSPGFFFFFFQNFSSLLGRVKSVLINSGAVVRYILRVFSHLCSGKFSHGTMLQPAVKRWGLKFSQALQV
jgi:hypothetical protein